MSSVAVDVVPALEDMVDLRVVLDVAGLHERGADGLGERPDPSLDERLDGAEADGGSLRVERLGDAPGDGVVVGDPEDERLLALEQPHPSASLTDDHTIDDHAVAIVSSWPVATAARSTLQPGDANPRPLG